MKVLVSGGSGLVGTSIKDLVSNTMHNDDYIFLKSTDCDLRNEFQVDELFRNIKPDIVVHLAAQVGGLYFNTNSNYKMLVNNIKINTNILECCEKYKVKRLINTLSTCVFGNNLNYPLTSDQMYDKKPDNSNEGYSYSKRLLDTGSKLLTQCSDLKVVNLIPTNLFGANDNYNLYKGHVLPAIIHKTFIAKKNFQPLIIKGIGTSLRQFVLSDDLARIILHFIDCKLEKQFNQLIVGPIENEISIKELVNKIVQIFEFNGEVIYDSNFSEGQYKKTVDDSELLAYIPYFKFTSLDVSLKKTIDYFIENYNTVRK